jgi:hypothetical protein
MRQDIKTVLDLKIQELDLWKAEAQNYAWEMDKWVRDVEEVVVESGLEFSVKPDVFMGELTFELTDVRSLPSTHPIITKVAALLNEKIPDRFEDQTWNRKWPQRKWKFYLEGCTIVIAAKINTEEGDCKVIQETKEVTYNRIVCDELERELLTNEDP